MRLERYIYTVFTILLLVVTITPVQAGVDEGTGKLSGSVSVNGLQLCSSKGNVKKILESMGYKISTSNKYTLDTKKNENNVQYVRVTSKRNPDVVDGVLYSAHGIPAGEGNEAFNKAKNNFKQHLGSNFKCAPPRGRLKIESCTYRTNKDHYYIEYVSSSKRIVVSARTSCI